MVSNQNATSSSQNAVFSNQQQMQMPPGSFPINMMQMPPSQMMAPKMKMQEKPKEKSEVNLSELSNIS